MSWLRSCAHCSCSWGNIDLFCKNCWSGLWESVEYKQSVHRGEEFKTSSLLSWRENNSCVESFAHAQKGAGLLLARKRVVEQYLPLLDGPVPKSIFYVSKNKVRDHGYEWALAFAQTLKRPMRALFIEDKENYKSKNKWQRKQTGRVQPIFDIGKNETHGSWFIDDIRTTGVTARSAWLALQKPECFHAVVIVQRELCKPSDSKKEGSFYSV